METISQVRPCQQLANSSYLYLCCGERKCVPMSICILSAPKSDFYAKVSKVDQQARLAMHSFLQEKTFRDPLETRTNSVIWALFCG